MHHSKLAATLVSLSVALSACARQPEQHLVITPEPIFNKFGEATGCSSGYELDSTSTTCEPVDDGCDPTHETCGPWDDDDRPERTPDPTGRTPDPQ